MISTSVWLFLGIHLGFSLNADIQTEGKGRALTPVQEAISLGDRLFSDGDYARAFARFEEALRLTGGAGPADDELLLLMKLGLTAWNLGRMDVSASFYERGLENARARGRKTQEEECRTALEIHRLYSKGKNERSAGEYRASLRSFEDAILLAQKIRSPHHEIKCLRQMSLNHWETGEIDDYFRLNRRGQEIAHRFNNRREEGISHNNLGLYYWKKNAFSDAIRSFQSSIEFADREGSPENMSDSLTNIGLVYMDLGDYEKALDYLNRGVSIDQTLNNSYNLATDLNNLGNVYLHMGAQARTDGLYERALDSFYNALILAAGVGNVRIQAIVQNNIGEVFFAKSEFDQALRYYSKSLKSASDSGLRDLVSLLNNNIANAYVGQGLFDRAIESYRTSIRRASEIDYDKILWESLFGLARCYEGKRRADLAEEFYDGAIRVIEKTRSRIYLDTFKAGYSRNKSGVYESFLHFLFQNKARGRRPSFEENMYFYVEKAKARAFTEILQESRTDLENAVDPVKRKELDASSRTISSLYLEFLRNDLKEKGREELERRLSREEDAYLRIISSLKAIDPSIAGLVYAEPFSLARLREEELDGRTAILEYFVGEKMSFLLLITRSDCSVFALPARASIEASIKAYLKYVSSAPDPLFDAASASKRIFREFLFPLEAAAREGIHKIILIPDGVLHYLPFETAVLPGEGRAPEYLIDRFQVSYAPSVSALMMLKATAGGSDPDQGFLAFGNPVSERERIPPAPGNAGSPAGEYRPLPEALFSPLPYATREVNRVSGYFPEGRRSVYLGREASEDHLKARAGGRFQVIHLACHSLSDEEHPIRSALILGGGRDSLNDGILQVRELYQMKLKANLVILSACQTGMGRLEKREGVLGLQRAFFYAGAESVLSTLWPVKDKSTAVFMENFYRFLAEGQSKAAALRSAKRQMIRSKYGHPYYWAGFLLSGEPDAPVKFH